MKSIVFIVFFILFSFHASAQYWFGPKIGISFIDHIYQQSDYEDNFDVDTDINYQVGGAIAYTASDMYSVYGELLYERIDKTVKDIATNGAIANTSMTNHFISAPVMLRITLGTVPFHYYVNGGPRLSYWLGGSGSQTLSELVEAAPDPELAQGGRDYTITFNSDRVLDSEGIDDVKALVSNPNRLQFGLTAGGGLMFDLANGSRLQVDFRYTWVHSNMGTNSDTDDTNFVFNDYRENFEYYHNIATIGVAYLFGFDAKLKRKGRSTNKESNKKKK